MSHNELCQLIVWPGATKPICKETLQKAFPEELAAGKARLKKELLSEWLDVVRNGEDHARWRAIEFGLRHINGWRDDAPHMQMNIDASDGERPGMKIQFVLPNSQRLLDMDQYDDQRAAAKTGHPTREYYDRSVSVPASSAYDHRTNHDTQHAPAAASSPTRIMPSPDDVVIERADRMPSAFRKRGSWMD
jgi:hypothetical protein